MPSEKTLKLIETVKSMSDWEADILDVFLAGFHAGRQSAGKNGEPAPSDPPPDRAGQA